MMDMNGDGYISRAESRSFGDKMFRDTDANRDYRLSWDEFMAQKRNEWQNYRADRHVNRTATTNNTMMRDRNVGETVVNEDY